MGTITFKHFRDRQGEFFGARMGGDIPDRKMLVDVTLTAQGIEGFECIRCLVELPRLTGGGEDYVGAVRVRTISGATFVLLDDHDDGKIKFMDALARANKGEDVILTNSSYIKRFEVSS